MNERDTKCKDVKILGVFFNKNGISPNNLNNVKNKIIQSTHSWNSVK